jgi:hypothetical protein
VSTTRLPDLRLHDLIRHQRGPLHDAGLITDAEYAALAADHGAVARLEGYDALRAENDRLRAALTERTTERDDARRMLAECYVLSGADTDGNTVESGWEHLWRDAVAEVRTLREGYDEAVDGPAVHPSDCQSCSEDPNPCRTHAEDWRYWRARALDFEEGASVEAREADRGRKRAAEMERALVDRAGLHPLASAVLDAYEAWCRETPDGAGTEREPEARGVFKEALRAWDRTGFPRTAEPSPTAPDYPHDSAHAPCDNADGDTLVSPVDSNHLGRRWGSLSVEERAGLPIGTVIACEGYAKRKAGPDEWTGEDGFTFTEAPGELDDGNVIESVPSAVIESVPGGRG